MEPIFGSMIIEEQNALGTNEGCAKFLKMISDETLKNLAEKELRQHKTSIDRWNAFKNIAETANKQVTNMAAL